ncbi:hypothetical protein AMECASPLE_039275, partial [Ameca splendens]
MTSLTLLGAAFCVRHYPASEDNVHRRPEDVTKTPVYTSFLFRSVWLRPGQTMYLSCMLSSGPKELGAEHNIVTTDVV